ncbi:ATP-binding protein [Streptomyces scopuliridis]|uniref:ATP-binding protein n=1 Tax=Streptomyces scopuliridis TaxID=452529 RepID=UPI0036827375
MAVAGTRQRTTRPRLASRRGADPSRPPHHLVEDALGATASGVRRRRAGQSGGSGLGPSIVRQFIEAHSETVTVKSRPGTKTVFTLRMPAPSPKPVRRDG